jgi:hypothetical protein
LLIDFEPGTVTRPETGPSGRGAGQPGPFDVTIRAPASV